MLIAGLNTSPSDTPPTATTALELTLKLKSRQETHYQFAFFSYLIGDVVGRTRGMSTVSI